MRNIPGKRRRALMGCFCGILIFFISLGGTVFASSPQAPEKSGCSDSALRFTEEEELWLEEHPVILLGAMDAWPPFNFVDQRGNPSGIGSDLVGGPQ